MSWDEIQNGWAEIQVPVGMSAAGVLSGSGTTATADVVPTPFSISAQSAYPQAAVNTAGAALNLAGGIGQRFFTIVTNTGLATKTVTLTANGTLVTLTAVAGAPGANQFQVGTDDTAPQLAVTATNLAAAIAAQATLGPLMTPSASAAVVYLAKTPTLNTLAIASGTAGALVTATSGADGAIATNGQILAPDGTALLPSYASASNPGTGLRFTPGVIYFSINGTSIGYMDSGALALHALGINASGRLDLLGDIYLTRLAAARLQFGSSDAPAPVAQTLSFQGARGGTDSDVAGVAATLQGSLGTGLGAGGAYLVKVGKVGTTGTASHVATTAFQAQGNASGVFASHGAVGAAVASATAITPTANVFHVTGVTTIQTINLPYTGFVGPLVIIPDGVFATGLTGNIALASTAVVGKALIFHYDATTVKWYPSY